MLESGRVDVDGERRMRRKKKKLKQISVHIYKFIYIALQYTEKSAMYFVALFKTALSLSMLQKDLLLVLTLYGL